MKIKIYRGKQTMRIKGFKGLERVLRTIKKKVCFDETETKSVVSSIYKLTEVKEDFVKAAKAYLSMKAPKEVEYKGNNNFTSGRRKQLIQDFTLSEEEFKEIDDFTVLSESTYLYNLLEDCSDMYVKQDAEIEKRLKEAQEVKNLFKRLVCGLYAAKLGSWVYVVDSKRGAVDKINIKGLKEINYNCKTYTVEAITENAEKIEVIDLSTGVARFLGDWKSAEQKVDKGYRRIEQTLDIGKVYFKVHILIIILEYDINLAKQILGRYSLLTCHHINNIPWDNRLENLAVVTRQSNRLAADNKNYIPYDFIGFYEKIDAGL